MIEAPSKDTEAVVAALGRHIRRLPATLRRSLTSDEGWRRMETDAGGIASGGEWRIFGSEPKSKTETPLQTH